MDNTIALRCSDRVLDWKTPKALLFQAGLVLSAVALPALCHMASAPVRVFLPMHWPVLAAGLVYGWRAGLLAGLCAPLAAFALSGMPSGPALVYMGAEIGVYGLVAGLAREKAGLNAFLSVALALVAGRAVYCAFVLYVFPAGLALPYLGRALYAGSAAGLAQIITLPLLARAWVRR